MPTDNLEESKDELEEGPDFIYSNTPTSATDMINIAVSENGAILMQLLSFIPEAVIENHRTMLNPAYVEEFIDELCEAVDYYPKKPKKKSKK